MKECLQLGLGINLASVSLRIEVFALVTCPAEPVFCPQAEKPYFDTRLDGWVLSRYADVLAAFSSADLRLVGAATKTLSQPIDEPARLKMRAETREALSPDRLRSWRRQILSHARERAAGFPPGRPFDLINDYAEPVCLALATLVTNPHAPRDCDLHQLAAQVAMAAAEPLDEQIKRKAKAATAELRPFFTTGPEPMRDSGFVALSRTLVSLLGNAWFALVRHPQEWQRLHARPALVARGVEELQRFAGLTRLLFRRALADTTLNGLAIRKGERVILCLPAANRDPDRFPDPGQFSVTRPRIGHLSLGAGRNACVGAPMIRMATVTATLALVERFSSVRLLEPVEWCGGSGYVSPVRLVVCADSTNVI
jgi:cytochrome P450